MKIKLYIKIIKKTFSLQSGSNRGPLTWEAVTLTTELFGIC